MSKPPFLDFATNATYSDGPDVGDPTKIAMDSGDTSDGNIKGLGYAPNAKKYNWWMNGVGLWVRRMDAMLEAKFFQLFDSNTTTSAPDAQSFKFNHATPSSVTAIRIADANVDNESLVPLLQQSGAFRVWFHNSTLSVLHGFDVDESKTDESGYTTWTVTYVPGGTGSFTNNAEYHISLGGGGGVGGDGDDGEDGEDGDTGRAGGESFSFTFDDSDTGQSDPGNETAKSDNADPALVTAWFFDNNAIDGADLDTAWYNSIPAESTLTVWDKDTPNNIAIYKIRDTADLGGYRRIRISETIYVKPGTWNFSTDSGNLVMSLGRVPESPDVGAPDGMACMANPWMRTRTNDDDVNRFADRRVYWVPVLNQWQMIAFDRATSTTEANTGRTTYGRPRLFIAGNPEGGATGLTSQWSDDAQKSWNASTFIGDDALHKDVNFVLSMPYPYNDPVAAITVASFNRDTGADSATEKLYTSANGGISWTGRTLNRSDTFGPRAGVFTGQNLVVCYAAGTSNYYEISADEGVNWTNVDKPDSAPRHHLACNRTGVVIGVQESAGANDYDHSTDHGASFGAAAFPTMTETEKICGVAYLQKTDRFYAITTEARVTSSPDGATWDPWTDIKVPQPNWNRPSIPLDQGRGFKSFGRLLCCPFFNTDPLDTNASLTDLFYSRDGITWRPSGQFDRGLMGDPTDGNPRRVHLATTTEGPWIKADRTQAFFTDAYGGAVDAHLSHADFERTVNSNSTSTVTGGGGELQALFRLLYDDNANNDPANYSFTFDNASPGSATWIRIDDYNVDGVGIANYLQIPTGALLTLRSLDGTADIRLRATSAPTDGAGFTQFGVTVLGSTGTLVDSDTYVLELDAVGADEGAQFARIVEDFYVSSGFANFTLDTNESGGGGSPVLAIADGLGSEHPGTVAFTTASEESTGAHVCLAAAGDALNGSERMLVHFQTPADFFTDFSGNFAYRQFYAGWGPRLNWTNVLSIDPSQPTTNALFIAFGMPDGGTGTTGADKLRLFVRDAADDSVDDIATLSPNTWYTAELYLPEPGVARCVLYDASGAVQATQDASQAVVIANVTGAPILIGGENNLVDGGWNVVVDRVEFSKMVAR